jgi:hypothetical protein
MADVEIDLEGVARARDTLDDIKERYDAEPIWVTGSSAEYSIDLEFGTEDFPPYPFFRPAVRDLRRDPESFIERNTDETFDMDSLETSEDVVEAVALALERQLKLNVSADRAAGRRSPGTDVDHPKVDTGNLRAGIRAERIA